MKIAITCIRLRLFGCQPGLSSRDVRKCCCVGRKKECYESRLEMSKAIIVGNVPMTQQSMSKLGDFPRHRRNTPPSTSIHWLIRDLKITRLFLQITARNEDLHCSLALVFSPHRSGTSHQNGSTIQSLAYCPYSQSHSKLFHPHSHTLLPLWAFDFSRHVDTDPRVVSFPSHGISIPNRYPSGHPCLSSRIRHST